MYQGPYSFWELLVFSSLITVVLTVGVIVCILAKVSFIRHGFERHMNIWHGGVYIVNISKSIPYLFLGRRPDDLNTVNNKMFGQLSHKEILAAKRALASSESVEHKEFNLDIAKLLFVPSPWPVSIPLLIREHLYDPDSSSQA